MRGDRVKIVNSSHIHQESTDVLVYVYGVKTDDKGNPTYNFDGTVQVLSLGGVKSGTTGVVVGEPEKCHRTQLKEHDGIAAMGGKDYVTLLPVQLDYYQKLGYFPVDHIRIV